MTRPGGRLGLDLVPDLTRWKEYRRRVTLRGTIGGAEIALVESVRQDRRRGLTLFDEEYIERRQRARRVHRFSLAFRTVSVKQMTRRLERAGFHVDAVFGDYSGGPWDSQAETWLILATRIRTRNRRRGDRRDIQHSWPGRTRIASSNTCCATGPPGSEPHR